MELVQAAGTDVVLSVVILGMLLVYGVSVLAVAVVMMYRRRAWQPMRLLGLFICVLASILTALVHLRNLSMNFSGWYADLILRYAQSIRMQALAAGLAALGFLVLLVGQASNRLPLRRSMMWLLAAMAFLTFAVAGEYIAFATQLTLWSPTSPTGLALVNWGLVAASLLAGWLAFYARPGKRVRYPWYWYAFWLGAASPFVYPFSVEAAPDIEQHESEGRDTDGG